MSIYNDGTNADGTNAPDSLAEPDLLTQEEVTEAVELASEVMINILKGVAAGERPDRRRHGASIAVWRNPAAS